MKLKRIKCEDAVELSKLIDEGWVIIGSLDNDKIVLGERPVLGRQGPRYSKIGERLEGSQATAIAIATRDGSVRSKQLSIEAKITIGSARTSLSVLTKSGRLRRKSPGVYVIPKTKMKSDI